MSEKIGLISDVHAAPGPLAEALAIFAGEGIETILCAGDLAGYGPDLAATIDLLIAANCRSVLGNHDLWWLDDAERRETAGNQRIERYMQNLPVKIGFDFGGRQVVMVHGSPPDSVMGGIRLLDEHGQLIEAQRAAWEVELRTASFDLLVVGHTHQVFARRLGGGLVVNPGSTVFNHTCAIVHLPGLEVEFRPLGGKSPVLSWNWRMLDET